VIAKHTQCGFEPNYQNFTIGRDGYSLHPFKECFWKDGIVNLNGKSYSWNEETKKWIRQNPTYHLATLKLTEKFKDLDDQKYQFKSSHHAAYDSNEMEQLNVINELVTRIRSEDTESITNLLQTKKIESQFWNLPEGVHTLRNSITIALLSTIIITALIIASWIAIKSINGNRQKETGDFALRFQAWQVRLQQKLRKEKKKKNRRSNNQQRQKETTNPTSTNLV